MLVGVPVAAAVAALISLRRVQISPLGVSRRATPKPPTFWRLIALVIGVGLYVYGLSKTTHEEHRRARLPGPAAHDDRPGHRRAVAHRAGGAAVRPARPRIVGAARDPAAGRQPEGAPSASVTGLVLAVFLGTMVGTLVPAVNATEATPGRRGR